MVLEKRQTRRGRRVVQLHTIMGSLVRKGQEITEEASLRKVAGPPQGWEPTGSCICFTPHNNYKPMTGRGYIRFQSFKRKGKLQILAWNRLTCSHMNPLCGVVYCPYIPADSARVRVVPWQGGGLLDWEGGLGPF